MATSNPANPTHSLEIERKFEVWRDIALPTHLEQLGLRVGAPVTFHQTATYFDTVLRELAHRGIAVRHRSGGADDGWHVKIRTPQGTRELQWPEAPEAPAGLVDEVVRVAQLPSAELEPIAHIATVRTRVILSDAEGNERAELVDDRVRAVDHANGVARAWREWEAELRPDAPLELLGDLAPHLTALGASHSVSDSKIGRALGRGGALAAVRGEGVGALAWHALTDAADRIEGGIERSSDDPRAAQLRQLAETLLLEHRSTLQDPGV